MQTSSPSLDDALCYYDGPDPLTLKRAKAYLAQRTDYRDPEHMEPEEVAKLFNVPVEYLTEGESLCL